MLFLSQFLFMELFTDHNCSKDVFRWTLIFKLLLLSAYIMSFFEKLWAFKNIIKILFFFPKMQKNHNIPVMLKLSSTILIKYHNWGRGKVGRDNNGCSLGKTESILLLVQVEGLYYGFINYAQGLRSICPVRSN